MTLNKSLQPVPDIHVHVYYFQRKVMLNYIFQQTKAPVTEFTVPNQMKQSYVFRKEIF